MYAFEIDEPLDSGLSRIIAERLAENIVFLEALPTAPIENVHLIRKNIKRIRAAMRLARFGLGESAYRKDNTAMRALGKLLSGARDTAVLLQMVDYLFPRTGNEDNASAVFIRKLQGDLSAEIKKAYNDLVVDRKLQAALKNGFSISIEAWEKEKANFSIEDLRSGYARNYRQSHRALKVIRKLDNSPEQHHAWRRRVKYHWYHHQLLINLVDDPLTYQGNLRALDHLGELLGNAHDVHVFSLWLASASYENIPVEMLEKVELTRLDLEGSARAHGERLFPKKWSDDRLIFRNSQ